MSEKDLIEIQIKALTIFDANNKMMSVSECAEYLGIHYKTVINRIDAGDITAIFQGKSYLIPRLQFVKKLIEDFLIQTENNEPTTMSEEEKYAMAVENWFKEKLFEPKN